VEDYQLTAHELHIDLDSMHSEVERTPDGAQRVFRLVAGSPTVADTDEGFGCDRIGISHSARTVRPASKIPKGNPRSIAKSPGAEGGGCANRRSMI
jgi:hypothetical protein